MINSDDFREAMQRFPGPVTAITTIEDGIPAGLMATAVCSLSADPPSLIACVNKTATAHDAILRQGFFGVSVLPDALKAFADHFARARGADRFEGALWIMQTTGAPLLAGATVAFDCRIAKVHEGFSHSILIGVIHDILLPNENANRCLLWHRKGFVSVAAQDREEQPS
ncbi:MULTISPECIES: flavin reductase family protein [unclassified Mesorhizobium]|uniref:flavin reductase family protein n=1 Tax=unclassified Mesorhizobium TaxID=325217 RepID=UPI002415941B|nr:MULTISPECIES: flavin reductase family protein [unclassified Mesorhizobium]MDG4890117.1 flavin reductase family protein [Mesorhizobium sp. WSM4887]MDG4904259.1 flavin reductase family protein [Mesorhizobium sp. WSM4962]MDG4909286.1 flavin reductase family protein [Mesorhizobium sp. WSM4898]MDG4921910.1 flavin reductase family protein [Mesorhizobium sp. WSM4989]